MKEPDQPRIGYSIAAKISEVIRWCRSERITNVIGGRLDQSPNGKTLIVDAPKLTESSRAEVVPLHIIKRRPAYIPAPESAASEGYTRLYVEWGTLNDIVADNWDDYHDINATTYFFAKAYLRGVDTLQVYRWEIVSGDSSTSHQNADWTVGAERPTEAVVMLAMVTVTNGVATISNTGGGSLNLTEHISIVQGGSSAGEVLIGKQLLFTRQNY